MNPIAIIERARVAGSEWASLPLQRRRKLLNRLAHTFALHQDDLLAAIVADTGKPALDALGGDILVTLEHMRFLHQRAHKILAPRQLERNRLLTGCSTFKECLEPHGVVLVFGPSNYPLQLAVVPAITALYAGNAVLIKLSEHVPLLADTLHGLIQEAHLPENLLQIVSEPPQTAASYIEARPDFVCFTGSSANGILIAKQCAKYLIPTLMELGGKDAALVFRDCDFKRTVEGVLYGAFVNSGQVCVGIKRLYIEEPLFRDFTERLVERMEELRIASDRETKFDLTRIKSPAALNRLSLQIEDALARDAEVLNDTHDITGSTPLLLANVPEDARLLTEEAFGPILCVAPFRSEEDGVRLANKSVFSLGASIWTRDHKKAFRVSRRLHAANIAVNDVIRNIANPAAPFGGNKASGYGRYHGVAGLQTFSRTKTIMSNTSSTSHQSNWFPFTPEKIRQLRRLIRCRYGTFLRHFCWVLFALFTASEKSACGEEAAGHLHLHVDVTGAQKGQLAFLIFDSADGFPGNPSKSFRHGFLDQDASLNDIDLGELPKGRYAVSLYLDLNGNKKLDTGWLGIPKEPVGASRNPRSRMGPPRFADCVINMTGEDQTLEIKMVSPK